jgi:hypothetical protein
MQQVPKSTKSIKAEKWAVAASYLTVAASLLLALAAAGSAWAVDFGRDGEHRA